MQNSMTKILFFFVYITVNTITAIMIARMITPMKMRHIFLFLHLFRRSLACLNCVSALEISSVAMVTAVSILSTVSPYTNALKKIQF